MKVAYSHSVKNLLKRESDWIPERTSRRHHCCMTQPILSFITYIIYTYIMSCKSSMISLLFYSLFYFCVFIVGALAYSFTERFTIFRPFLEILWITFLVLFFSSVLLCTVYFVHDRLDKQKKYIYKLKRHCFLIIGVIAGSLIYTTLQEILFIHDCFQASPASGCGDLINFPKKIESHRARWWPAGEWSLGCRNEGDGQLKFWILDWALIAFVISLISHRCIR